MSFALWTGKIFNSFEETGFSTDHHFSTAEYIEKIKSRFKSDSNISELSPLTLAVKMISYKNQNKSAINIVDFGGGCGSALHNVAEEISENTSLNYLNIENEEILKFFKEITKEKSISSKKICAYGASSIDSTQSTELFGSQPNVDILLMGGVLQYIEKEIDLLKILCSEFNPKFIILDDVYVARKSFITTQKFYDLHEVPFKFTDMDTLNEVTNAIDGKIIFMTDRTPIYQGKEIFYSTNNLPIQGQIDRAKTLFIER